MKQLQDLQKHYEMLPQSAVSLHDQLIRAMLTQIMAELAEIKKRLPPIKHPTAIANVSWKMFAMIAATPPSTEELAVFRDRWITPYFNQPGLSHVILDLAGANFCLSDINLIFGVLATRLGQNTLKEYLKIENCTPEMTAEIWRCIAENG